MTTNGVIVLLQRCLSEVQDVRSVSDSAVADSVIDLETAIAFATCAVAAPTRENLHRALQKVAGVLPRAEDGGGLSDEVDHALAHWDDAWVG